jgi:hypothetical protein
MVQYARRIRKEPTMTDQTAEAPRPAPEVRIALIIGVVRRPNIRSASHERTG